MNKNKLLTFLSLTSGAAASISTINKYIQLHATSKNLLELPIHSVTNGVWEIFITLKQEMENHYS